MLFIVTTKLFVLRFFYRNFLVANVFFEEAEKKDNIQNFVRSLRFSVQSFLLIYCIVFRPALCFFPRSLVHIFRFRFSSVLACFPRFFCTIKKTKHSLYAYLILALCCWFRFSFELRIYSVSVENRAQRLLDWHQTQCHYLIADDTKFFLWYCQ